MEVSTRLCLGTQGHASKKIRVILMASIPEPMAMDGASESPSHIDLYSITHLA
jgi:hypothetical protein